MRLGRCRRSTATVWFISRREKRVGSQPERKSVAVLPFKNLSSDPEQAYFADGVTEEILNRTFWRDVIYA